MARPNLPPGEAFNKFATIRLKAADLLRLERAADRLNLPSALLGRLALLFVVARLEAGESPAFLFADDKGDARGKPSRGRRAAAPSKKSTARKGGRTS